MTNETLTWRVIFDNGGGITLQMEGTFAHRYDDPHHAAVDFAIYLGGDCNISDWDGHSEDAMDLDPTDEEIRNGGYRVATSMEELESLGDPDNGWGNAIQFLAAFQEL